MTRVWIATLLCVGLAGPLAAQSRSAFNGRVSDQVGAVLPGAAVVATNTATGVVRETVANSEGLYSIPALQPGLYDVKVDLSGFAPQTKKGLTLATDTTLTIDFSLSVATLAETLTVTASAPLVETSKSDVSASLRTSEVENLPMLNRNFTGLVTLVPGARPAAVHNPTKQTMGASMSFGGGGGRNVVVSVDGGDNRDDIVGGPLQNYTIEGIEEFKLLSKQFGAQYARTGGAVLQITTKSGTNQLRGSVFGVGRNDAMTGIDLFTVQNKLAKPSYDREQFGGSIGGPIIKDRLFLFGAAEWIRQNSLFTFPANVFTQAGTLAAALPSVGVIPAATIPVPYRDLMYTVKTDFQASPQHSLFLRWAHQRNNQDNVQLTGGTHADLSTPTTDKNDIWSMLGNETWVIGNTSLNQFSFLLNRYVDVIDTINDVPPIRTLTFPSLAVGKVGGFDQTFRQTKVQLKDDFTQQRGKHSVKFGGEFALYPQLNVITDITFWGSVGFFDDPSTIANNTNGRYPQGFLTPGIVSAISLGSSGAGGPKTDTYPVGEKEFGSYIQDDWRLNPRLTLNFGARYDVTINGFNQRETASSRSYQVYKAIGSPWGRLPKTPTRDFAPRVGLAYDVRGSGQDVLRGGFGVFWDKNMQANQWQTNALMKPTIWVTSTYVNTGIGAGQLANYIYGVSPLPPGPPPLPTQLPPGNSNAGPWIDPDITDPHNLQYHIGYSRQLSSTMVLATDFTHVEGLHEYRLRQINPIEGPWDPTADPATYGRRRMAPALQAVFNDPNLIGPATILTSANQSRFDELIFHFERRASRTTFQASYTLAWANGYGGAIAGIGQAGSPTPQPVNADDFYGPGEWGPTLTDERHRVVLSGVFNLPGGIQASPVFQIASARPYTLTAGTDLNRDGTNNDRYIDPASGQMVGANSERGEPTWNLDARVTKLFNLGSGARKLGVFAELFNLTNRANFGNIFQGNSRSPLFRQPIGYLPGLPTSRQLQLGARLTF